MRRLAAAGLLGLASLAAACVSDPWDDPVPGHETRVVLLPDAPEARGRWPDAWRRGARFVIENRTGRPVETLIFDLSIVGRPRELREIAVVDPPGRPATILPGPHGEFPLRARIGDPGSVLLEPGESLALLVRVDGSPGRSVAVVTVPGE